MFVQEAGHARVEIDVAAGCRLSSLTIDGHELLVTSRAGPIEWGCYPMAPYAGRVRHGRFRFAGRDYDLPRTLGGHAIHGTVYLREWEDEGTGSLVTQLGPEWPFPGFVRQEIRLGATELALRLEVHADRGAMPASCGWHPWFKRVVDGAGAQLDFLPGFMLERDAEGIATRDRVAVPEGPWDDCFGDVARSPTITWPGVARLEMESTCPYWVAFTEREHALCVEPQTAPPDALNRDPFIVEPGHPLVTTMTLRWAVWQPGGAPNPGFGRR
jgi:aldose 1-epimerase